MKAAIRQRALELGFDDCRFATAEPPASAQQLHDWLAAHRHGEMTWLERNAPKRADPQLVLPGARAVICLAASYYPGGCRQPGVSPSHRGSHSQSDEPAFDRHPPTATGNSGVVARYARFQDYHEVLGARLQALAQFVSERGGPGTRSVWYVDTGPVLEREYAQRAGIGFIGKHTNLISRKCGNWIFLAEILTTQEFEPDRPEPNRCGACTRCLAACPTQAITAPFQLDARRCISYLTIELKGPIPVELRPAIGTRIFGCDDCLEVCPWNRFAREGSLMKPYRRTDLTMLDLIELLKLDGAGFKGRFGGTPLERAKRRGLQRNVCVALGNVGNREALPVLAQTAAEADALVAEHARWALERIKQCRRD